MKGKVMKFCVPPSQLPFMHWTSEQRAFAVEAHFSNGRSIIATQRAFRTRFRIRPFDQLNALTMGAVICPMSSLKLSDTKIQVMSFSIKSIL